MNNKLLTIGLTATGAYLAYKLFIDVKEDIKKEKKIETKKALKDPNTKSKLMEELNRATQIKESLGKLKPDQVAFVKRMIDTATLPPARISELINVYKKLNKEMYENKQKIVNELSQIPAGKTRKEAIDEANSMVKEIQNALEEGAYKNYDGRPIEEYARASLIKLPELDDFSNISLSGTRNRIKRVYIPRQYLR